MGDHEAVMRVLIAFFESHGWTIDLEKWEAVMSSGYGSGPAVIDLDELTEAILSVMKHDSGKSDDHA